MVQVRISQIYDVIFAVENLKWLGFVKSILNILNILKSENYLWKPFVRFYLKYFVKFTEFLCTVIFIDVLFVFSTLFKT